MSAKRIIALTVLGLIAFLIIAAIVAVILVQSHPDWYEPAQLSPQELLEAEEQMIRTAARFKSAAEVAEPFILELTGRQINDRLAVLVDKYYVLPNNIADPVIHLGDGAVWIGARVSWKGRQAVVSTRLTANVDSAGLLYLKLDKLKAGTLGLPDTFLADTLRKLERTLTARVAASSSDSDQARTARKNQDLLARIFAALDGSPVELRFVTREDLQVVVDDIRIKPNLLEIQFRPIPPEPLPN